MLAQKVCCFKGPKEGEGIFFAKVSSTFATAACQGHFGDPNRLKNAQTLNATAYRLRLFSKCFGKQGNRGVRKEHVGWNPEFQVHVPQACPHHYQNVEIRVLLCATAHGKAARLLVASSCFEAKVLQCFGNPAERSITCRSNKHNPSSSPPAKRVIKDQPARL